MIGLSSRTTLKSLSCAVFVIGLNVAAPAVQAQQSMTVEQLEAFIQEKREKLQMAIEERDATVERQQAMNEKLEEQVVRQQQIEQELRNLCNEREEVQPGSLTQCLIELDIATN